MKPVIEQWKALVKNCRRGSANGKRHPHQPAVLLCFVDQVSSGNPRLRNWDNGKAEWANAIKSKNGSGSPESPITALVNAGVLECSSKLSQSASSPSARKVLNEMNPVIGLPEAVWRAILANPSVKAELVQFLNSQFD
jgi:hypothetical protein